MISQTLFITFHNQNIQITRREKNGKFASIDEKFNLVKLMFDISLSGEPITVSRALLALRVI